MDMARAFHNYPAPGPDSSAAYMVEMGPAPPCPEDILFDAVCESANCLPRRRAAAHRPAPSATAWLRIQKPGPVTPCACTTSSRAGGVRVRPGPRTSWSRGPKSAVWHFKEKPQEGTGLRTPCNRRSARRALPSSRPRRSRWPPPSWARPGAGPIGRCPPVRRAPTPVRHGGICRSCQGESPYVSGHGVRPVRTTRADPRPKLGRPGTWDDAVGPPRPCTT